MKYEFTIPLAHNPVPHQNEIKYSRYGAKKTDKLRYYQNHIGLFAKNAMNRNNWEIIKGHFKLSVVLVCCNKKRGDITNMIKSVEDALEKIVYENDRFCIEQHNRIEYDKLKPRLDIVVESCKI